MTSTRRVAGWIVAGNLLVASILVLATIITLRTSREVDLARAREATENLAHGLSLELAAELRLVDNALTTIGLRYARSAHLPDRDHMLRLALQEQRQLLPFVTTLQATDARGAVRAGSSASEAVFPMPDRSYFERSAAVDHMLISDPVRIPAFKGWCLIAARRLRTGDGQIHGIVYAVLSAEHFHRLFRKLTIGGSGAISLRTDSMHLAARYSSAEPDSSRGLGSSHVSDQLKAALARNRDLGWYITPTALDNIERLSAYRRVPGYPLIVLAGVSTDSFLAPWKSAAWRQAAFTGVILLLIATGSALIYAKHRREHAARLQASRLAKEQSLLLENDLVGMLRVQDRKILWANKAAFRILGHAPEVLLNASTRLLYPDDATYARIGEQGYADLKARGRFHTQLKLQTADGPTLWVDFSGAALSEDESIWMMVDIDQLKHSEEQAQHQALHDPLTGLANRRLLEIQLRQALAQAKRSQQEVALAYLDLDGFKPVNDRLGHQAGDHVLQTVAARLTRELRTNDTVARLGGDEFVLLLSGVNGAASAKAVLQRCIDAIQHPITFGNGEQVSVGCSAGLALGSAQENAAQQLLLLADETMYAAKRAGRGRIVCARAPATPVPA